MGQPTFRGFQETLNAAIADFVEHGFDSQERIEKWVRELQIAADRYLWSGKDRRDNLRDAFQAIYDRLVTRGAILKQHPGVSRLTLQHVAPKFRAELERRIMVSADLIKLNREDAIAATLRRFSGWASSVPNGGTGAADKRETRASVSKELRSLSYRERFVAIDQGHKFVAALNQTLADQEGAIALRWASRWRALNYNYRESHKERDGKIYLLRDSWARKQGLVKPGDAGFYDEVTAVGEEPNCFPGSTPIQFADHVEVAYRRWYSGETATVTTDSGETLCATPNHPVLTPQGWVAIGSLNEGDYLIERADKIVAAARGTEPNDDQAVATISQIFGAVFEAGLRSKARGSRLQFHGDGADSDVDIVYAARPLAFGGQISRAKSFRKLLLAITDSLSAARRALHPLLNSVLLASARFMGVRHNVAPLLLIGVGEAGKVGGRAASYGDPSFNQSLDNGGTTKTHALRYTQAALPAVVSGDDRGDVDRFAGGAADLGAKVEARLVKPGKESIGLEAEDSGHLRDAFPFVTKAARVVKVERATFTGHVYNLQTASGMYVASNIVTHNCRCSAVFIYSLSRLPEDMLTAKGKAELATLREKRNAA